MIAIIPRSDEEWDEGTPIFYGIGSVSTLGSDKAKDAKPVKKEPVGFLHSYLPKKRVRKNPT